VQSAKLKIDKKNYSRFLFQKCHLKSECLIYRVGGIECPLSKVLRRDVLFSLVAWVRSRLCCLGKLRIRLTLWGMNVSSCGEACARTEINCSMSGHDRWHWKAPYSTNLYLREISRVWLNRRWWEHGRLNGNLRILVIFHILFFQIRHFGPGLRAKWRIEGLYAMCQGNYLDIALFDRILVDFELLKIWCVCVCV
jgi:hypothetical protein